MFKSIIEIDSSILTTFSVFKFCNSFAFHSSF